MSALTWGRFCLIAAIVLNAWLAAHADDVVIQAPPGFAQPDTDDRTLIDVFFNGRRVAEAAARFNPESLRFEDPEALAAALPGLRDLEPIAQALARRQPTHSDQVCDPEDGSRPCGYIYPSDIALIFDPARLKADLFINDRYTYQRDPRARFLPPPTVSPGLISNFQTRTLYDFDRGETVGAHNLRLVAGRGRTAVRGNLFANSLSDQRLRSAYLTTSGQRHDRSSGLLPQQFGGGLARSRQLLGVRYSTSLKTRLDKASLNATALDIAVGQAATIEIRRDGELLDVQQVRPGQRQLDTDRLPRGAYTVDLIIKEGTETRTESRYFTTTSGLPPSDAPQWYVEAGTALPITAQSGLVPNGDTPILAFGRHQRMGSNWAAKVDATLTDQILFLEAGAQIRTERFSGSASVLTSGTGTRGLAISGAANQGRWQLNGSYRHLGLGLQTLSLSAREYDPFPSGYRQASLSANRATAWGRVGLRGFYFDSDIGGENWFAGPYADLVILDRDSWRMNLLLRQDWASNRSNSFVGLRLSKAFNRPPAPLLNARLSARLDASRSEPRQSGETLQTVVTETALSADLLRSRFNRVSSFVRMRDEDELGAQLGLAISNPALETRLEGRYQFQNQTTALLDLRTGFALSQGGVSLTASPLESGAMVKLEGAARGPVYLRENGRTRAIARAKSHQGLRGGRGYLPLQPFTLADIGIQPARSQDVTYDQSTDRFIVYPGNIMQTERTLREVRIMVGQLSDLNGRGYANAVLTHADASLANLGSLRSFESLGTTDADGYFQIDASPGDQIAARLPDGETCAFTLPDSPDGSSDPGEAQPFVQIGLQTCEPS